MAGATVWIEIENLRDYMQRLLRAVGCTEEDAKTAAGVFLEADLRGIQKQGLDHMHTMIRNIKKGIIDPKGKPRVVRDGPAFALIDGNYGPGQIAAILAADIAIAKGKAAGSAAVGITRSSDIYMIGFYADRIARAGLVGFTFSNGGPVASAHGGMEPVLGTNPIAIAFPTPGDDPIVLDMSTSTLSGSEVRFNRFLGKRLPPGSGRGPDGRETDDPVLVREGGFSTLGGAKGFGLSMCVAILGGTLNGSHVGKALTGWGWKEIAGKPGDMGHFLIAIDPDAFGDAERFRESVGAYTQDIKSSRRVAGGGPIRVPGERSFEDRRRNAGLGRVPLYDFVWDEMAKIAKGIGVTPPEITAA